MRREDPTTVVIGAGPAGLAAALALTRADRTVTVLEKDPNHVGGLARTLEFRGFRFDIGGHRFYSRNPEIERLWGEALGDRLIVRDRLSRIYYRGRFFRYPLEPLDALAKLGLGEAVACAASYALRRRRNASEIRSFEDWVVDAFGRRFYEIFFKSYTEKVWGVPCREISADWAAQRIRGLSIRSLMRSALGRNGNGAIVRTLVDRFRYPRHGPGEMWDSFCRLVRDGGGEVRMGESVRRIRWGAGGVRDVVTVGKNGETVHTADRFVATMPLRLLIESLDPRPENPVLEAAARLRYRDFLTVALIVEKADLFPDQWIYVHDPSVRVGRIQNFKNWSPDMVPDPHRTLLGLEYFCSADDPLWSASDEALCALGRRELASLGLIDGARVSDGMVVRQRRAYPFYDHGYRESVDVIRRFLGRFLPNLEVAGRNGMHKYDNQDHAMMTGIVAAQNVLGDRRDPWRVNGDAEYVEDGPVDGASRLVPLSFTASPAKERAGAARRVV